jgi:hypothetical protein
VALRIPRNFIEERCARYIRKGKIVARPEITNDSEYSIVCDYQSKYSGYVQYYRLAINLTWLSKLHWVMQTSLLKTLAHKHKSCVKKMASKYVKSAQLPQGPRKCVEVIVEREGKKPLVARFGGLSFERNSLAKIIDLPLGEKRPPRSELLKRLLADTCELCGAEKDVEVHHIRALKDLRVNGKKELPLWIQVMSARKRKTLVVCHDCHRAIHRGKGGQQPNTDRDTGRAV